MCVWKKTVFPNYIDCVGIDVNYIACKLVCTFLSFLYLLVKNLKICYKNWNTKKNIIPTLKIFFGLFDYKDTPIQKKKLLFFLLLASGAKLVGSTITTSTSTIYCLLLIGSNSECLNLNICYSYTFNGSLLCFVYTFFWIDTHVKRFETIF